MSDTDIKKYNYESFKRGIFKENPSLVLLLGMCPTLAVTTKVSNAVGMGLAATIVLIFSNILISLLKDFIPDKVRIPAYVVIIASLVTVIDLLIQALLPALSTALGVFLPLIVVNCIILGRAEAFASKNSVFPSILDAVGMGIGFTIALLILATVREFFGSLQFDFKDFGLSIIQFGNDAKIKIFNTDLYGATKILTMPAGGFFVLGIILAIKQAYQNKKDRNNQG